MTRRGRRATAEARSEQARGIRLALARPRRAVVGRALDPEGRIVRDLLECGHHYRPCPDRRREYTRTRRCDECRERGLR